MTPPPTVMADKARVQAVVEQPVASEAKVSECKVHVLLELVKYSVLTCKENGRHVPWDTRSPAPASPLSPRDCEVVPICSSNKADRSVSGF